MNTDQDDAIRGARSAAVHYRRGSRGFTDDVLRTYLAVKALDPSTKITTALDFALVFSGSERWARAAAFRLAELLRPAELMRGAIPMPACDCFIRIVRVVRPPVDLEKAIDRAIVAHGPETEALAGIDRFATSQQASGTPTGALTDKVRAELIGLMHRTDGGWALEDALRWATVAYGDGAEVKDAAKALGLVDSKELPLLDRELCKVLVDQVGSGTTSQELVDVALALAVPPAQAVP